MKKMLTNIFFLLSFTQLSIWSKNFVGNGLGPTLSLGVFTLVIQSDFPCKRCAKRAFWGGCSNNILDSQARAFSKVRKNRNNDPIVKLGSLGHNSLEYCAYLSLPWLWAIIPINVMGNCPSPQIIFFAICNIKNVVFAWSILSWIKQRNSSFNCTNSNLQVWYKLLHDSWCKRHFSTSIHIPLHHYCSFPILILNLLVIRTNNTLQKYSLSFLHQHWDGVSSSTCSSQITKYLQCLIHCWSAKM